MRSLIVVALLLCFCFAFAAQNQSTKIREPQPAIGPEALWQPGMGIMDAVRQGCTSAPDFGDCFAAQMRKSGATPEAVAFTRLIDNDGFMRDFRDAGRVDVAYVDYPFRANENQGCLLVNGDPRVIDVDDTSALSKNDLQRNAQYARLAAKRPNIAVFPGDRNGTDYPKVEKSEDGGQRFIVAYRLTDGCHACERIGSAKVAFDFDRTGKFLGRKLLAVDETPGAAAQPGEGDAPTGSQTVAPPPSSAPVAPQPSTIQQPASQDSQPPEDVEPPVKKKKYVPATSLIEALYLASREDTDGEAYLKQAKSMIGQPGVNLKSADAQGRTPLHWIVLGAIYADRKQSVLYADLAELLLAAGADINHEDQYGNTSLDYQEFSSAEELLELLLENDARHGNGKDQSEQLEGLLRRLRAAAGSGDIEGVRSALAADLPLSTLLPIKLTTEVSSKRSRAGDAVSAVVSAPITVNGRTVVAPGTKIEGTVLYSDDSPNRFERSQLVLGFTNLLNPDGTKSRLALRVTEVENAREKVESNRIIGVSYPNSALSQKKVSWGMRLTGAAFPAIGYAMEAATTIYGKKFDREIRYMPGTDMTLEVMLPVDLKVPADLKRV